MALDQVGRDFVVVVEEKNVVAAGFEQAGVARGALAGLVALEDPQGKLGKGSGQVVAAARGGGLVDDQDLGGRHGLPAQLAEQRLEVRVAVEGGHQNGHALVFYWVRGRLARIFALKTRSGRGRPRSQ